jgi:perosamine synthetase
MGPKALGLVKKVLDSGWTYNMVADFEKVFAEACGTDYAVGVSNCTAANHAVLGALGIGPGDEVVVSAISDYGSIAGIGYEGATVVFSDVDEHTGKATAEEMEKVITPRTKAIIAVHFYGQMCEMDPIVELGARHGVPVIEDVAQTTLGHYKGKAAGSIGDAGTFSFNSSKLLSTNTGGAVTTNDGELAEAVHRFAVDRGAIYLVNQIGAARYHPNPGFNYRMGELEAGVAIANLETLPEQNQKRIERAEKLSAELNKIDGLITPRVKERGSHLYWMYHVQFEREKFRVGMDQIERAINAEGLDGMFPMYYLIPHSHHFLENREQDLARLVNARSHVERTFRFSWTYKMTDDDITDIAQVFAKVTDAYRA